MPTLRQRRAVEKIVENGGIVSKAMREVGYTRETSKVPQKLTESKGFKQLCEEYGLTDQLLLTALVSDIKKKPKNRKAELELAFKVKGRLTEKESGSFTQNIVIINADQTRRIAERIVRSSDNGGESGEEELS